MITSFDIKDPAKTHISWMPKVPALAKPRKFEFKPGLNILWGKNGSGKSTIIKAMARLLHCEQGGTPCLTYNSVRTLEDNREVKPKDLLESMSLVHDGQGVRYFDPSAAAGLLAGGAAFDDDFFMMGVGNAMFKGSAGQTTMYRFDKIAGEILEGKVPTLERKATRLRDNEAPIEEFLKAQIEQGQPTILLDEPERSYDLSLQVRIWRFIRAYSTSVQFIVASHSLYALRLPEANYIEMDDGYYIESLLALAALSKWSEEAPKQFPAEKLAALRKGK